LNDVTLTTLRRTVPSGVCMLLLAACGGGDEPAAKAAATPADSASAAPAAALPAAPLAVPPGDSAAPVPVSTDSVSRAAKQILEAPVAGPVNVETLEDYQLTMERIRKLGQAGQSLGELQRRRPELRDSMRLEAFDPNAMYEKMNSIPDVRDAISRVGMTPREYATATAALMQAAMVSQMLQRGMQPQVEYNEANVKFVTDHWEEIMTLVRSMAPQQRPES
jgi:hypothetical protein